MASRRKCREAVFINGKLRSRFNKTHRGMRAHAKQKFVAKAAAPGARVPQAELFALERKSGQTPQSSRHRLRNLFSTGWSSSYR